MVLLKNLLNRLNLFKDIPQMLSKVSYVALQHELLSYEIIFECIKRKRLLHKNIE